MAAYRQVLKALPEVLQNALAEDWGAPEEDAAVQDGMFHFSVVRSGNLLIALQPERGNRKARETQYHDLSAVPCHGYVAFYLWLRAQQIHALVHLGAHGTLEWLPGKSAALSGACWPEALAGDLPVIYPFIVNDPGEAAQAKRRIGAVTIGHMPPPLAPSATPEHLIRLEALLDEYATAEGLDPPRRNRLITIIREEAQARGVEQDLGLAPDASLAEAVTRIDRFVCDLKESRFGEGLHVFGQGECGAAEQAGLLAALDGKRVAPGPSGSPARGRKDVLPTGRNMFAVDPRAIPTRASHAQGVKLAEELLRRHLQENGDWPKSLLVDLWGSATMRNAGEEFAMALHLAGLAPRWDEGSTRVTGFEILPPALLGRPRIDVTLRISGLFRDVFSHLAQLFAAGTEALAAREEAEGENPYIQRSPRVFGPRPGQYGLAMGDAPVIFTPEARGHAAEAWLEGASWSIGADGVSRETSQALRERLAGTDGFVHVQDLPETDLLLAADYAAHEGGIVAALASLGLSTPPLYHLDATNPEQPRARLLTEEISRVVRARAANPAWVRGMMAHGFRGGAELAATLDHMAAFANLAQAVPGHLFDLYFDATLGQAEVADFLAAQNPAALARMRDVFKRLRAAGLWETRSNAILAALGELRNDRASAWLVPGAWRPMLAEDGLILRIRPPLGRLTPAQARGLAALVRQHGQGRLSLTSRANLQWRGLAPEQHGALLDGLAALGLLDEDAALETARNIVLTPFWREGDGTLELARALVDALAEFPPLPGKFGFAIDTGAQPVLGDVSADIRLERDADGQLLVRADGAAWGQSVTPETAIDHIRALACWFLESGGAPEGRGRMRKHLAALQEPPGQNAAPAIAPVPGRHEAGMLAAFAFGEIPVETLTRLAELAPEIRLTPWRMVLLPGLDALADLPGAILNPDDPMLRVYACTGAPSCAQAHAPARAAGGGVGGASAQGGEPACLGLRQGLCASGTG